MQYAILQCTGAIALLLWSSSTVSTSTAFQTTLTTSYPNTNSIRSFHSPLQSSTTTSSSTSSTTPTTDNDFAQFAATLEDESSSSSSKSSSSSSKSSWQEDLEELLSPFTSTARRQVLTSQLVQANGDIRQSVQTAVRNGQLEPLLTPTARKLQDGTRVVARQLASDILPDTTRNLFLGRRRRRRGQSLPLSPPPPPPLPTAERISQLMSAVTTQLQKDVGLLQKNPRQIPQRLQQQQEELMSQLLDETPAGLAEPAYTVVHTTADYEIRDYESYQVVGTQMETTTTTTTSTNTDNDDSIDSDDSELYSSSSSSLQQSSTAFTSLASYLLGQNAKQMSIPMTTPVTTTATGEMRFYVRVDGNNNDNTIPTPNNPDLFVQTIPATRLAVRRFTGFCTRQEVSRQLEGLLVALNRDMNTAVTKPQPSPSSSSTLSSSNGNNGDSWTYGYLQAAHGQAVPYVTLEYNPPFSLPVTRRNEVAVVLE